MKRPIVIGCVLIIAAFILVQSLMGQKTQDDLQPFMRAKLAHTQKVLEGLTTENYGEIAKHAQDIALLSEDAQWQVFTTSDYMERSKEFRRVANSLSQAAHSRNIDGAALAYVELTLKCVECHKYIRGLKVLDIDRSKDQ